MTKTGGPVVVVEQDVCRLQGVRNRLYCFQEGRVSLQRASGELTRDQISRAYFGYRHDMTDWLNTIVQGLLLGGLYALFALGLSLDVRRHAIGQSRPWRSDPAGGVRQSSLRTLGLDPFDAVAVAGVLVLFVHRVTRCSVLLNRTLGRDILPPLLVTFGLSILIQNGLLEVFSADSQRLRAGDIETASIRLGGGLAVGVMPLLTLVSAIAVILALNFSSTALQLGRAFRATSDDLEAAQLMGIDNRAHLCTRDGRRLRGDHHRRGLSRLRANFDPTIGPARLIYAFEAVIIGGLGSFWGTLAGGIVLGVAQTIGARIDPEWQILAGPCRLPRRAGRCVRAACFRARRWIERDGRSPRARPVVPHRDRGQHRRALPPCAAVLVVLMLLRAAGLRRARR